MVRLKIENGDVCHVYNRGVEKRVVFLDEDDYLRYIHDLFEFNDEEPTPTTFSYLERKPRSLEVPLPKIERQPKKPLVDVLAFCLMPNHVHLMLHQRVASGITEFMRKIGTGYTNFFNKKYQRVGPLFQGTYKFIRLSRHEHLLHLPYYIHANALDVAFPEWRTNGIIDHTKAAEFLESYRWSSHQDYIGKKNFPSVTQRDFLLDLFGGASVYKDDMIRWLKERSFESLNVVTLE